MRRLIYLLLLQAAIVPSCVSTSVRAALDDIDSYIRERPDSALRALWDIDTTSLKTKKLRAEYSLLLAMALDKNYIDTTDLSIIAPAVEYYQRKGSPDERLMAYYYRGVIYKNAGDINGSALSYSLAEREAENAEDSLQMGLLYIALADMYGKICNYENELVYAGKGAMIFEAMGDTLHSRLNNGRLAKAYMNLHQWDIADSLFRNGIADAARDTFNMRGYLSNYSWMKVVQPDKDFVGAMDLIVRKYKEYKAPLTNQDYSVLAYCAEMLGDKDACDALLSQFETLSPQKRLNTLYMESLIAYSRGDYKAALQYFDRVFASQDTIVRRLLNNSLYHHLEHYYVSETETLRQSSKISEQRWIIAMLLLILISVVAIVYVMFRKKRQKEHLENIIRLGEQTNAMLLQANEAFENKQREYERNAASLEEKSRNLRVEYAKMYKMQYAEIDKLCRAYMEADEKDRDKTLYIKLKSELACYITDNVTQHKKFEDKINEELDNIVTHLKEDLGLNNEETRFVCYTIAGFTAETISAICNISTSAVYQRRKRLRERIESTKSPYKSQYRALV